MRINSAKDHISTYGSKAILGAHKRDEADAASDEAHDHVPVFQSLAYSIPSTPTFPWFLQPKQHKVLVIPATLGSGYRLCQLGKKLNMTGDRYPLIATHSITELLHSISPKKISTLQNVIETKTYFPENWLIFHNFRKSFRSNFIIHRDEEHDKPGIYASEAYDPFRALFRKPNITNLFQKISAADASADLPFINCENSLTKVVEFVSVTGKTHQSWCRIKEFGFSETIDVGAFYLNSVEISEEVLLSAQVLYTERRRRIVANRSGAIRVGVPAQLFQHFVKVETDPKTIADVNLTYIFYSFDGEHDDLVKQTVSRVKKFKLVNGCV